MPGRNRLADKIGARTAVGVVTRYRASESGTPSVDVSVGPVNYPDVPIQTVGGGGGPDRYAHLSVQTDPVKPLKINADGSKAAQVKLEFDQNGQPRAVGFIHHSDLGLVQSVDVPVQTDDRAAGVTADDHAIANGGAVVIVDSRGAVVVNVTLATDGNFRVQLPAAGVTRISRGGAASDRAVSGAQVLTYMAALEAHIDGLAARIAVLESAVPAAPAKLVPAPVIGPSRPTADNTLKLAALHISADTESA